MAERANNDDISLSPQVAFWKEEIEQYERAFDKWLRRGRKVMKRYKDIRSPREETVTRLNIFWANVQTRLPLLYARNPKAVVERRFRDKDPVGRVASEVLERSIQYTLDHCNDTYHINRQALLDFELPGRGVVWIRYEPHFHKEKLAAAESEKREGIDSQVEQLPDGAGALPGEADASDRGPTDNVQPPHGPEVEVPAQGIAVTNAGDDEVEEETLRYEQCKIDYVYWEDFGHSWGRNWEEARGRWRRVYMDQEELLERFTKGPNCPEGLTEEQLRSIPRDWSPKNLQDTKISPERKKAVVYEIWDSKKRQVLWLVKNYPEVLDIRDDPLGLEDFWPMPRPLSANLVNDSLEPTPNLAFYQDQANEVDELSSRITAITKALKVAGVRDTSAEGLDRLLAEGVENALVPVEGWALHKEKGGLAGVYELLPMKEIAETLGFIREQRKELVNDIYEITGTSDIVRGLTNPNETATAQQLKGQFSINRIQDAQEEVQLFARDEVRILGQIIAGYDIETLKQISGVKLLTKAEKQAAQDQIAAVQRFQQMMQAMQQRAQPPQGPGGAPPPGGPAPPGAVPPHPAAPAPGQPPGAAPGAGAQPQPGGPAQMPGMPPPPQPPSPQIMQLMEQPTWEEVGAVLQNPVLREFKLDIETDSTIRMDEEAEKNARMDLLKTVSAFLKEAIEAGMQAPEIMPMLGELLLFGIRAFKTARSVETVIEDAMEALVKASKQPRPNPEMAKMQGELQLKEKVAQLDQQTDERKQQAQAREDQAEQQFETQRAQHQAQIDMQLETFKAKLKAQVDTQIEQMKIQAEAQRQQADHGHEMRMKQMELGGNMRMKGMELSHQARQASHERTNQRTVAREGAAVKSAQTSSKEEGAKRAQKSHKEDLGAIHGSMRQLAETLQKPRRVVRDANGKIAGIE